MRNVLVFVILSLTISLPSAVFSATDDEALTSLKKFRSRCEVGISYAEYSSALADSQYQVKEYLESANAKRNPEFAQYISDALSDYRRAGLLWNIKATLPSGDYVWEDNDGGLWVEFVKAYPDGVRLLQTSKYVGQGRYTLFSSMLSYIWEQASQKIVKASGLMDDRPPRKPKTLDNSVP